MADDSHPRGPSESDLAALAQFAGALADGVERALPGWVDRCVRTTLAAAGTGSGFGDPATVDQLIATASRQAVESVAPAVRDLLALDVEQQRTNPLALIRHAVRFPTEVLRTLGVPPVERDRQAADLFPDDWYDLIPTGFADLDPDLREPGLLWGAAKAHVILARRRAAGA